MAYAELEQGLPLNSDDMAGGFEDQLPRVRTIPVLLRHHIARFEIARRCSRVAADLRRPTAVDVIFPRAAPEPFEMFKSGRERRDHADARQSRERLRNFIILFETEHAVSFRRNALPEHNHPRRRLIVIDYL